MNLRKNLVIVILTVICLSVSACSSSGKNASSSTATVTEGADKVKAEDKDKGKDKDKDASEDISSKTSSDNEMKVGDSEILPEIVQKGTEGEDVGSVEDGSVDASSVEDDNGFTPEIPVSGGINYEYEIVSAFDDNGNEASWNHMTWFVSYQRDYTIVQAPIWIECEWEGAIGTEEERLPAGFKKGELTLTSYSAGEDYVGELGSSKTLRFDIKGSTATVYNVDDGITYNCVLYRSFTF